MKIIDTDNAAVLAAGINGRLAELTEEQAAALDRVGDPLIAIYEPHIAGTFGGCFPYLPLAEDDFDSLIFAADGGKTWYLVIAAQILAHRDSTVLCFVNEALLHALEYGPETEIDLVAAYQRTAEEIREELDAADE